MHPQHVFYVLRQYRVIRSTVSAPSALGDNVSVGGRADESHPFLSTAILRVYCHVRGSMSCSVKTMTDRQFSLDHAAVRTKTHTQWLSPKQWSRTSRRPSPCSTRRDTVSTTLNVSWNYRASYRLKFIDLMRSLDSASYELSTIFSSSQQESLTSPRLRSS